MNRLPLTVVVVLLVSALTAVAARADADPASDSLYRGRVFLPLSAKVSPALAGRLAADALAAEQAGKPIRVALIGGPLDLGGVPALFGRPTQYARFLDAELQFVYPGLVLVVMPQGAALAKNGRLVANKDVVTTLVAPGADGLARTAIKLVERLSGVRAARATPIPTNPTAPPAHVLTSPAPRLASRKRGLPGWAAAAIAIGTVALLLVPAFLLVQLRRRRPLTPEPPRDPDDPYRYRGP
jgi:hypothetical protein